jgi:hypothetical protein|tara:strand:+ start:1068 stop:1478 length:411 start_codon:yes stop_codon:yes gene_type:complete
MYKNTTGIVSFKIVKEINYINENIATEKELDYEHLQNETFNRVHIPDFSFKRKDSSITYESDYIKGIQICEHNKAKYKDIIFEDIVKKQNDYSFTSYHYTNFIIEEYTNRIYYIDLDDYRMITLNERIKRFNKFWK